ncbi:MAG: hypothetical protein ACR2JE_07005 [Acidobacteriaceae bacterium]
MGTYGNMVWRGICENQMKGYQAAAADFRAALRIYPHAQPAHYNLALSLLRLGDVASGMFCQQSELKERLSIPRIGPVGRSARATEAAAQPGSGGRHGARGRRADDQRSA